MKEQSGVSRRQFLGWAGGGVGAAAMARLVGAQQRFSQELVEEASANLFDRLARAYTLDPKITYLNHGAIGTIPRVVQEAHRRYLDLCETNPWLYMWGGPWARPLESTRERVAAALGCSPQETALIHNTTEAFNLLALGWPLGKGDEVLFSSLNHDGASACWLHQAPKRGFTVKRFDFPVEGIETLSRDALLNLYDAQITKNTKALVFPHVDNHFGVRHPVRELTALARSKGVRFVAVDAAQTVGMLPLSAPELGVDVLATSAHKWLQAPKGLGVLYVRQESQADLHPFWVTWGQEPYQGTARIFEDYGTRNLPAALALGDAVDFQQSIGAEAREDHLHRLWTHARERVAASPKLSWNSPGTWEMGASLFAVGLKEEGAMDAARRLVHQHGVIIRPFAEEGLNALRVSPNAANTVVELDRFFDLMG
jgi:selenocysteine lyase/cysteine desulfurase